MDETEVKLSGKFEGIQRLADSVGTFYTKAAEVLDHLGDVFGEMTDALKAYTITTVHQYKFETDPEYGLLKKKLAIMKMKRELQILEFETAPEYVKAERLVASKRIKHEQSDLDRTRSRLEKEIKILEIKKERAGRTNHNSGVKQSLKTGTAEVSDSKAAALARERKPLTHRLSLEDKQLEETEPTTTVSE